MRRKFFLVGAVTASAVVFAMIAGCAATSASSGAAASAAPSAPAASSAAASSVSSALSTAASSAGYRQISQQEAQSMMDSESGYVILDVRTQQEFADGHIPGAICVPNESIGTTPPAELPDFDQLVMVYCRSGSRSKQAAEKLADMGYTNVVEFGGINTWPGEVTTS